MELIDFIKSKPSHFRPKILTVFAISGILNFLVIAVIIASANQTEEADLRNILLFVVGIITFVKTQKFSMDRSASIAEEMVTNIRIRLADMIRRAELSTFENLGRNSLMNLLTQETMNVSEAIKLTSRICSSLTLLIVAFLYIAYLSMPAFFASVGLIILGVFVYTVRRNEIESDLVQASKQEDRFFDILSHLLDGFKEIKISTAKNNDLFKNYLQVQGDTTEKLKVASSSKLNNMIIFAQVFCYILMAAMIFIFPKFFPIETSVLVQIVTLILFITTGPLQEVVGSFPYMERANVAIRHLREMEEFLERITLEEIPAADRLIKPRPFESLECQGLTFQYDHSGRDSQFGIGPLDLTVRRGEIVFLMGGNGAGKSTFLKTLTGLYYPTGGKILLNGRTVTRRGFPRYRANFTVIFQDTHLFDRLYGIPEVDPVTAETMLERMGLEDKTSISEDGQFETINLSAGQKKRLALVAAEFEDKEIYVFDEWAADQDPSFRKYFYEVYLPDLKQRGKTVLAVTHDDKYYGVADRVCKMEYGTLSEVEE